MSTGGSVVPGVDDAGNLTSQVPHTPSGTPQAATLSPAETPSANELFAQPVRSYVVQAAGRPVRLLHAGSAAYRDDLALDQLAGDGYDIDVLAIDHEGLADAGRRPARDGDPAHQRSGGTTVADLRSVPLPPRSFDIVHCALLLHRVPHAELILDRFAAALRPDGLLLLRIRDRDCAAGFLDRKSPAWIRRMLWARLHPGEPGPFPAIYDQASSASGIQAFALMRGLVIVTQRRTSGARPADGQAAAGLDRMVVAAGHLVSRLSRGRLTDAHDEVLFVIKKPQDRFARVVLVDPDGA